MFNFWSIGLPHPGVIRGFPILGVSVRKIADLKMFQQAKKKSTAGYFFQTENEFSGGNIPPPITAIGPPLAAAIDLSSLFYLPKKKWTMAEKK